MCPGEEAIAAYVAGRLARGERDTLDLHLDTCSACHELLAALAKVGVRAPLGTPPSSLGEQLGRYVLLGHLGAGGMGVVYAAYDPQLDRKIALKLLRDTGDRARTRLVEEARAIARLAHPHVVAVHDIGETDGETFVAMEHVDGFTLGEWLKARRTADEILDVFVQAARGLAAAHAVGLVHRDVKPSNIMIGKDGRARVLDFGLASARGDDTVVVGTPAYMAPEQQRGERIDARADQYSLCVALWEALDGKRPEPGETRSLPNVSERVNRALRRGLAEQPADRFPSLGDLVRELAPPPRGRRWKIATFAIGALLSLALVLVVVLRDPAAPSCARAGDPIARRWNDAQRVALRAAFARTGLPFAAAAAGETIGELDAWAARWQTSAHATCKATVIDRVQPAELHARRQACLDQLAERVAAVIALATTADAKLVARASTLVADLPAPERCDEAAALVALAPEPPGEGARAEVVALRAAMADAEAAIRAGRALSLRTEVDVLARRADALGYGPLQARAQFVVSRFEQANARYDQSIAALHAAARAATAARDLGLLAEIWIDLVQTLGNDPRTLEEAGVFEGYAAALLRQLPDRDALELQLEFARCNRNNDPRKPHDPKTLAAHCEAAIAHAERMRPPRHGIANAARSRLGHFQRLAGDDAKARATLIAAVAEAERVNGPHHPDTAIAHYVLGIAELSANRIDDAIVELRTALAIRRRAYPDGSIQVAESLQGLGDALAVKGDHAEAIVVLEEALALLDEAGQGDSAHAANTRILVGMSLEEVARLDDATAHYLRAADIADRSLQHRESLAAMALRLAADIAARTKHGAVGVGHLERALRLLERGKSAPAELAKTQQRMSQVLLSLGATESARAKTMAVAARGNFVVAGAPAAAELAAHDEFMKAQGWR